MNNIINSYVSKEETKKKKQTGNFTKCEIFNKDIYVSPSFRKKGCGRFCGIECRGIAQRKRVTKSCQACNKQYIVTKAREFKSKFCSSSCCGKGKSEKLKLMAKKAADKRWGNL